MRPQQQKNETDCFRTCLASILELDALTIPDFVGDEEAGGQQWWIALGKWLSQRGMAAVSIHDGVGNALTIWQDLLHIASGPGPRGHRHAVIGRLEADDSEIRWHLVHDPHQSGEGLVGDPDRFYFILPLDPARCLTP